MNLLQFLCFTHTFLFFLNRALGYLMDSHSSAFTHIILHHILDSASSDYHFTPSEVVLTLFILFLQYHSHYGLDDTFGSSRDMTYHHKEFLLGIDKLWHIQNQSNTTNPGNHKWIFPFCCSAFLTCLSNFW